jgi:hypothetical protein
MGIKHNRAKGSSVKIGEAPIFVKVISRQNPGKRNKGNPDCWFENPDCPILMEMRDLAA